MTSGQRVWTPVHVGMPLVRGVSGLPETRVIDNRRPGMDIHYLCLLTCPISLQSWSGPYQNLAKCAISDRSPSRPVQYFRSSDRQRSRYTDPAAASHPVLGSAIEFERECARFDSDSCRIHPLQWHHRNRPIPHSAPKIRHYCTDLPFFHLLFHDDHCRWWPLIFCHVSTSPRRHLHCI